MHPQELPLRGRRSQTEYSVCKHSSLRWGPGSSRSSALQGEATLACYCLVQVTWRHAAATQMCTQMCVCIIYEHVSSYYIWACEVMYLCIKWPQTSSFSHVLWGATSAPYPGMIRSHFCVLFIFHFHVLKHKSYCGAVPFESSQRLPGDLGMKSAALWTRVLWAAPASAGL